MKKEIVNIHLHYENIKVQFKGDDNWYFMNPGFFIGTKVDGQIVNKRTRTWFEK